MQKPLMFWFLIIFSLCSLSVDKNSTADLAPMGFRVMSFWYHGLSSRTCDKGFNLCVFCLPLLPSLSPSPFLHLSLSHVSFPFPFACFLSLSLYPVLTLSLSPPPLPLFLLSLSPFLPPLLPPFILLSLFLFFSLFLSLSFSLSSFSLSLSLSLSHSLTLAPHNSATGETTVDNKNQSSDFLSISLHMSDNEKDKEEVSTK